MKIRLEAVDADNCAGKWKVLHLNESLYHNHPASEDPSFHPGHQRRGMQQLTSSALSTSDLASAQTAVGVRPEVVAATIRRANPDTSITAKDYLKPKGCWATRGFDWRYSDGNPSQEIDDTIFFYKIEVNPDTSRLRYLFWFHPGILQFWNSNVLIIAYTYKNNLYDLPLLNVIAMTNMNTVLPIAQSWLPGEKEDFIWAIQQLQAMMESYEIAWPSVILTDRDLACMNAIGGLFPGEPSLVCRWHMNRNVLAKTRTILGQVEISNSASGQNRFENTVATHQFMDLYYDDVTSPAEADFKTRCAAIRSPNVELTDYLDKYWWKYKTKLVRCWTSQYLHLSIEIRLQSKAHNRSANDGWNRREVICSHHSRNGCPGGTPVLRRLVQEWSEMWAKCRTFFKLNATRLWCCSSAGTR